MTMILVAFMLAGGAYATTGQGAAASWQPDFQPLAADAGKPTVTTMKATYYKSMADCTAGQAIASAEDVSMGVMAVGGCSAWDEGGMAQSMVCHANDTATITVYEDTKSTWTDHKDDDPVGPIECKSMIFAGEMKCGAAIRLDCANVPLPDHVTDPSGWSVCTNTGAGSGAPTKQPQQFLPGIPSPTSSSGVSTPEECMQMVKAESQICGDQGIMTFGPNNGCACPDPKSNPGCNGRKGADEEMYRALTITTINVEKDTCTAIKLPHPDGATAAKFTWEGYCGPEGGASSAGAAMSGLVACAIALVFGVLLN